MIDEQEIMRLREAAATAYGLLWRMAVDKSTKDGMLKSMARTTLLDVLTDQERRDGVARAVAMVTPN